MKIKTLVQGEELNIFVGVETYVSYISPTDLPSANKRFWCRLWLTWSQLNNWHDDITSSVFRCCHSSERPGCLWFLLEFWYNWHHRRCQLSEGEGHCEMVQPWSRGDNQFENYKPMHLQFLFTRPNILNICPFTWWEWSCLMSTSLEYFFVKYDFHKENMSRKLE